MHACNTSSLRTPPQTACVHFFVAKGFTMPQQQKVLPCPSPRSLNTSVGRGKSARPQLKANTRPTRTAFRLRATKPHPRKFMVTFRSALRRKCMSTRFKSTSSRVSFGPKKVHNAKQSTLHVRKIRSCQQKSERKMDAQRCVQKPASKNPKPCVQNFGGKILDAPGRIHKNGPWNDQIKKNQTPNPGAQNCVHFLLARFSNFYHVK